MPESSTAQARRTTVAVVGAWLRGLPTLAIISCLGTLIVFFRSLLQWPRFPALGDLIFFHLPLRAEFARLATIGLPQWNPMISGGQPILSNPNYAAFYPPSMFLLLVDPPRAVMLLALAHVVWGFAGSWSLARRLGCRPSAAVLAGLGFVGGGAFVSSLNLFNFFCALAWLPWVLAWTDRAFDARIARNGPWTALAAVGLAAQLLAGEPTVALATGLAVVAWSLTTGRRRAPRLRRAGIILLASLLCSAIQLLPTLDRLAEGARTRSDRATENLVWSTSPERLLELVFPRLHGEPTLAPRGLYFARGVHDKAYPYLGSIYPGQILLALAGAGLLSTPVPRRRAWILLSAVGLFLALGRHNPAYADALARLPPFAWIRYPERFLILATSAIPFAAALAWNRLAAADWRDRRRTMTAALAAALILLGAHLALAVGLAVLPDLAADFVQARTPENRAVSELARATAFMGRAALFQAAIALVLVALLAYLRRRPAPVWLLIALPLLAAADLALLQSHRRPTVPISSFETPAKSLRSTDGRVQRLVTDQGLFLDGRAPPLQASPGEAAPWIRRKVELLDPYVANLWGVAYVFNPDYDLMLTRWGREALGLFYRTAVRNGEQMPALLAAWSVDTLALRPQSPIAIDGPDDRSAAGDMRVVELRDPLPLARFVPAATVFRSLPAAQQAAASRGLSAATHEALVAEGSEPLDRTFSSTAVVESIARSAAGMTVEYRSADEALLVVATTYARAWRAEVGGRKLDVLPTALGQTAVVLPPGSGRLTLTYRQPRLASGATLTLLGLLGLVAMAARSERREQ